MLSNGVEYATLSLSRFLLTRRMLTSCVNARARSMQNRYIGDKEMVKSAWHVSRISDDRLMPHRNINDISSRAQPEQQQIFAHAERRGKRGFRSRGG